MRLLRVFLALALSAQAQTRYQFGDDPRWAGPIGMQLHAWPSAQEVLYKDIVVETFPAENRLLTTGR